MKSKKNGRGAKPLPENTPAQGSPPSGCQVSDHHKRMQRYGMARKHAREILGEVNWTISLNPQGPAGVYWPKIQKALAQCANFMEFRHYYLNRDNVREFQGSPKLYNLITCKKHLLCPICSILRANRYYKKATPVIGSILASNPHLRPYLLTLTVPNSEDLLAAFLNLVSGLRKLLHDRRTAKARTEFKKIHGGLYAVETKVGKGGGLWHPHIHAVVLCDPDHLPLVLDQKTMYLFDLYRNPDRLPPGLQQEWWELTGGVSIDLRPMVGDDLFSLLAECIKYGLKFTDMTPAQVLHAFTILRGRRLIGSFGSLYNVPLPEAGPDDDHPEDMAYLEYYYRYHNDHGYRRERVFDPLTGEEWKPSDQASNGE